MVIIICLVSLYVSKRISSNQAVAVIFCFTMIADIAMMMYHGELTVAHLVAVVGQLDLLQRIVSPGACGPWTFLEIKDGISNLKALWRSIDLGHQR